MADETNDTERPSEGQSPEPTRFESIHEIAADLNLEVLSPLRIRMMTAGASLASAGRAIDEACFSHPERSLTSHAELAASVQRNALAAGAIIADLIHTAGQLAGIASAVTESGAS
jgi:hypothetical protein